MLRQSDRFTVTSGVVAGATAGVYVLRLDSNGVDVLVKQIEVSSASAGTATYARTATAVTGGAALTEANVDGRGSSTPTAVATKGARGADHSVSNEVAHNTQKLLGGVPVIWKDEDYLMVLDGNAGHELTINIITAANDDECCATVQWEEMPA